VRTLVPSYAEEEEFSWDKDDEETPGGQIQGMKDATTHFGEWQ